jgi:hypothetical protein
MEWITGNVEKTVAIVVSWLIEIKVQSLMKWLKVFGLLQSDEEFN